jgi:N-acetylglucosamine kinase-like BadF-type ATPase
MDGGGSKVVCLAASQGGELLGFGRGGAVNTNYVLRKEAAGALYQAISTALQEAGLRGEQVTAMVVSAPVDPPTLEGVTQQLGIQRVIRAAEGETPRWAAQAWIQQHVGVTVDAGTGSLARGWTRDGRETGAGGFGATAGDEGSGFWIGLQAIRLVLQAHDGRVEHTTLTSPLLEYMGVAQVNELPLRISGGFITLEKMMEMDEGQNVVIDSGEVISEEKQVSENSENVSEKEAAQGGLYFRQPGHRRTLIRHEIAGLCPLVVAAARMGDPAALHILENAGRELGRLAAAVIQRLGMSETSTSKDFEEFAIVPFGGVFKAGELILRSFREVCLAAAPRAVIIQPRFEPVVGAVLVALRESGITIDDQVRGIIEESSRRFPFILTL